MAGGIDTGGGGFSAPSSATNGDFSGGTGGGGNTYNFGSRPALLGSSAVSTNSILMIAGAVLVTALLMKGRK